MQRYLVALAVTLMVAGSLTTAFAGTDDSKVLLAEDFEGLTLGESPQEAPGTADVWTNTPPADWTIDNDLPEGMDEWEGWSFASAEWWTTVAGDQERSQFTTAADAKGSGIVAIADPDEWDDAPPGDDAGTFNSKLSTPAIDIIPVAEPNSIKLIFDSSWRPEDTQNANVTVAFDGGDPVEILSMLSSGTDTIFTANGVEQTIPDGEQINETITLDIPNPSGAQTMVISWYMFDATNDWWWAIDNIQVTTTSYDPTAVDAQGKLATSWASLKR